MSRFKVLQKIQISRRGVSSYVTGVPFQTQNLTLDDFLKNSCERDSSALMAAFDQTNCTFTFGQMNKEAEKIAAGFISMGAKQGDRIAIFGPNEPQWLILKWACAKAGFQMVCINPLYTAYELEYAINKVGIKILVCPKSVGDALNYHKILTDMIPDLETQDKFNLNSKNVDVLEKIVFYSTDEEIGGVINWKDVEEAGDQSHYKILADVNINTHDIANIQFTSGTTGMPKAAALSHYNITNTTIASFQHQNSIIDHYNKTSDKDVRNFFW